MNYDSVSGERIQARSMLKSYWNSLQLMGANLVRLISSSGGIKYLPDNWIGMSLQQSVKFSQTESTSSSLAFCDAAVTNLLLSILCGVFGTTSIDVSLDITFMLSTPAIADWTSMCIGTLTFSYDETPVPISGLGALSKWEFLYSWK